jgi:hypothetical protein
MSYQLAIQFLLLVARVVGGLSLVLAGCLYLGLAESKYEFFAPEHLIKIFHYDLIAVALLIILKRLPFK